MIAKIFDVFFLLFLFVAHRLIRCATSSLGQELVARHGTTQDRKAPGMSWVPWIMIGGIRDKEAERHLIRQLCSRYLKPRPSECKMYGFEPTEDI
ncbi:hypothetical protein NECAME_12440 [Necator americanus]|uniref:Secreted protein n=1 Tax=Necator americanus TaxID=51031 RepID=W2T2A7_NECAM|nr:hypothetical protein NECAME_12440 [Necator americanus]ETN75346.1 hypothetical protein NECAME_12440 [Necator americanus]